MLNINSVFLRRLRLEGKMGILGIETEEVRSYLLVISQLLIVALNIFCGSHSNKCGCSNELQQSFIRK